MAAIKTLWYEQNYRLVAHVQGAQYLHAHVFDTYERAEKFRARVSEALNDAQANYFDASEAWALFSASKNVFRSQKPANKTLAEIGSEWLNSPVLDEKASAS